MNLVERGMTRCPCCVAPADYAFVETAPDTITYEVWCQRCDEVFLENTSTVDMPLFFDPAVYSYTPWSQRVRTGPWVRAGAIGQRCWGAAALAMSGAVHGVRTKVAELPLRLPQAAPMRELEAGPAAALPAT